PRLPSWQGNYSWSVWFHVTDPAAMRLVHAGGLAILVLFTLGIWTRVSAVLAWLVAMSYIQRSPITLFGMDTIISILLLYLMIGPSGAALSGDRLAARRPAPGAPARPAAAGSGAAGVGQPGPAAHASPLLFHLRRRRSVEAAGRRLVERHGPVGDAGELRVHPHPVRGLCRGIALALPTP